MLKPDYGKDRFEITITVHENCQTFNVRSLNGQPVKYQELIGALDISKMSYFFDQTGINIEEYRKWQKLQNKKKVNRNQK